MDNKRAWLYRIQIGYTGIQLEGVEMEYYINTMLSGDSSLSLVATGIRETNILISPQAEQPEAVALCASNAPVDVEIFNFESRQGEASCKYQAGEIVEAACSAGTAVLELSEKETF